MQITPIMGSLFDTYTYVIKGLFALRAVQNVILGVYTYLKDFKLRVD